MKTRHILSALTFTLVEYAAIRWLAQRGLSAVGSPSPAGIGVALGGAEFETERSSFSNGNPGVFGRDFT